MNTAKTKEQLKTLSNKVSNGALKSVKVVGSVATDFAAFLNRGNVVDLAVGVIIGAAF
eukprot:jgi/Hompol1/2708/HPOL_005628-RA